MDIHYIARFTPQAWIRDNAIEVDPQGPVEWDCTDELGRLPDTSTRRIIRDGHDNDDELKGDPNAPEWVREWSGPFEIHVQAAVRGPLNVDVACRTPKDHPARFIRLENAEAPEPPSSRIVAVDGRRLVALAADLEDVGLRLETDGDEDGETLARVAAELVTIAERTPAPESRRVD